MTPGAIDRSWAQWARIVFVVVTLAIIVGPLLLIIPMSFSAGTYLTFPPQSFSLRWYEAVMSDPRWFYAGLNSLTIAVATMAVSAVLGTLAAFFMVRSRMIGRSAIYALVISPIVVPPMVIAVGTYRVWSDLGLLNTSVGLVIAHSVLATPLVATSVAAVLHVFNRQLEDAAASLGASRLTTFWHVTFPIIRPGILTGALFAFVISFDEIIVTMFIAGLDTETLPKRLWDGIRYQIDPSVAVVSTLMMMVTLSAFVLMMLAQMKTRGGAQETAQ